MKKSLLAAALAAALVVPAVATAQDEDVNTGALTFNLSTDITTAYFFRGYNQADTGLIVQPAASVGFAVVDTDDFAATLTLGTWNSLHSQSPGQVWYESDFIAKLGMVHKGTGISGTLVYTYYTYPTDVRSDVQEIGLEFGLGIVDRLLEDNNAPFKLNPYIGIYRELYDSSGPSNPGGIDLTGEGIYLELGIVPSFALQVGEIPGTAGTPTLSFPIKTGMSIDDYYQDDTGDNEYFGYVSFGVGLSVPLAVPARWGSWTFTTGAEYLILTADSTEIANDGGESYELLGKAGISIAY